MNPAIWAGGAANAATRMLALLPSYQFRADTVTLSAGNVATIPNRRGSDALVMTAGTLAAPSADALFGGAQSIVFSGTQWLDSNLAASAWKFLHDGTGCEEFHVFTMTSVAGTQTFAATRDNGTTQGRSWLNIAGGQVGARVTVGAGTAVISSNVGGALAANTATYVNQAYGSAQPIKFSGFLKETNTLAVLTESSAPGSTDPQGTLRLGADRAAAAPASMKWCETLIFPRVLHEYERQIVREYIAARYGIAAPSLTGVDRSIMSMLPYSWEDAAAYTTSGGKVTAFLDRARPGHTYAQGTGANQVNDPVTSADFNGQLVVDPGAVIASFYASSLAETAWRFLHDGTTSYHVYAPARSASSTQWGSFLGTSNVGGNQRGIYFSLGRTAGAQDDRISGWVMNAQAVLANNYLVVEGADASAPINVSRLYSWRYRIGVDLRLKGASTTTGVINGSPASSAATGGTLRTFGAYGGSTAFNGKTPGFLIFNRALTSDEETRIESLLAAKYGVTV